MINNIPKHQFTPEFFDPTGALDFMGYCTTRDGLTVRDFYLAGALRCDVKAASDFKLAMVAHNLKQHLLKTGWLTVLTFTVPPSTHPDYNYAIKYSLVRMEITARRIDKDAAPLRG